MWKMLYFVTVIGVFLQTINGHQWDIEKLEQCPCENNVIEDFLESVSKNTIEIGNGQKLRLLLWQLSNEDCAVHVQDESPQPGQIEISMAYSGNVHIEEMGESDDAEDQQTSDEEQQRTIDIGQQQEFGDIGQQHVDIGQQQEVGDIGQQVDIGQQQEDGDIGQQQMDIGQQEEDWDIGQQQVDIGQQQEDWDIGQQQVDIGQQQEVGDIGQQQVDIGQQQEDGDIVLQQVDIGQQQEVGDIGQQQVDIGQEQEDGDIVQQQVPIGQQQEVGDIGQQQMDIGQQQTADDIGSTQDAYIEDMLASIDLEQLQQGIEQVHDVDLGQEQTNIGQEQSELSDGSYLETGGEKDYSAKFSFIVDVNTGTLSDSTGPIRINRRKRELMPFKTVIINITINNDQKPDSNDGTRNDQIKSLLKKSLKEYWMSMALCLFDVQE
ncbi:uncharacterized protein LOC143764926 [Ranitomeya variabilis]|uniref:uncharacterized protein LOC143764926 n=1 Tax=Ranitomeya variabilis TaxID=490064 RepID=UPI004055EE03